VELDALFSIIGFLAKASGKFIVCGTGQKACS
jgi:hypothetical protein